MDEKEIKEIKKKILKRQKEVKNSKDDATKYLIELGVLTKNGNLKKAFKPV